MPLPDHPRLDLGRPGVRVAAANDTPISGELQIELMAALWRLGGGTVEQVRSELPPRYRRAYTTIQTMLNRLAERGMLSRHRSGKAIEYRPSLSEAEYLSRSIAWVLAGASTDARRMALAGLLATLDDGEVSELRRVGLQTAVRSRPR
jgi:predicted transcriptional regulator